MKKKLEHFWYDYKWYVLFGILAALVVWNFAGQKAASAEPDVLVSFVTMEEIPAQTLDALRTRLEGLSEDSNGDGRAEAAVQVYHYDGKGSAFSDPEAYSAAAIHLATEIRMELADFFITDEPALLRDAGVLAEAGRWEDYAALRQLDSQQLSRFFIFTFAGGSPVLEELKLGSSE